MAMPDEQYEMNMEAKPNLLRLRIILENELKTGDILGYGAFGTVYKGIWLTEGHNRHIKVPVAIKVLNEVNPVAQQEMVEEAGHMARVSHPYLVRLIGICFAKQMMLVSPLMPLGNLLDYLKNYKNKIGSSALLRWCTQIAAGMAHLEDCRLVHRDLAARNVLVQNPYHVRITDFGLAKMLDYGQDELQVSDGKMPIKWLALECIQERKFTHKSDVWAFGVTIWELLTFGEKPYKGVLLQEILSLLEKGERLPQPTICTLDVYMIMVKCWMVDANSRPTFQELHESFSRMSKDPGRYLVIEGDKLLRLPSYSSQERADMMRRLIDDPNLCNPEDYLDSQQSTTTSAPPASPSKPLLSDHSVCRANGQRLQSTSSHRYQTDPLSSSKNLVATDVENYLLPDSQKLLQKQNLHQYAPDSSQIYERPVAYIPVLSDPPKNHTAMRENCSTPENLYYNELTTFDEAPNFGRLSPNEECKEETFADNPTYMLPDSSKIKKKDVETLNGKDIDLSCFDFLDKETVV